MLVKAKENLQKAIDNGDIKEVESWINIIRKLNSIKDVFEKGKEEDFVGINLKVLYDDETIKEVADSIREKVEKDLADRIAIGQIEPNKFGMKISDKDGNEKFTVDNEGLHVTGDLKVTNKNNLRQLAKELLKIYKEELMRETL